MKRSPFPMRLRVTVPGHNGALHVHGQERDGYLVAFDFSTPSGWWIYDVRVVSADYIETLTGVRLAAELECTGGPP
jgi:hypothetical protein